jgi:hypothetical protein
MTKRERTKRREVMRGLEKLADAREKLAALEPGGTPERPLEVESASQIEIRAQALPCLRCEGELKLHEHRSIVHAKGGPLREIELVCKTCSAHRLVWYRVGKLLS